MAEPDAELTAEAGRFADEMAGLLDCTVCDDPPIRAMTVADRIVVAPFTDSGEKTDIPLTVAGEHRLDLRIEFRCVWDFTGKFLAIAKSEFALKVPHLREALIRFDYLRDHSWSPAHVQLHAESSALGYLHAFTGTTKPPKVQQLHIPVGGRRLRPCLEDVIDFAIRDLAVEPKIGWEARIEEGRRAWKRLQVKSAIRDVIKHDPQSAPAELREAITQAERDVITTP